MLNLGTKWLQLNYNQFFEQTSDVPVDFLPNNYGYDVIYTFVISTLLSIFNLKIRVKIIIKIVDTKRQLMIK